MGWIGSLSGCKAAWALLLVGLLNGCSDQGAGAANAGIDRWYSPQQVEQGRALYRTYCADCHGPRGEGAPDWRLPLVDGAYPPPPVNGQGHSTQHALVELERIINLGGISLGGRMPPFSDKFQRSEVRALIAYCQSLWPEAVYRRWATQGGF